MCCCCCFEGSGLVLLLFWEAVLSKDVINQ
jgi:hypothetical protein